jgi:hypothetical protein
MGFQMLGRPWSEGQLIKFAYAYEQVSHHRRPPPSVPPLADSLAAKFIGTWRLAAVNERDTATGAGKPAARSVGRPADLRRQRPALHADRGVRPQQSFPGLRRGLFQLLRPVGTRAHRGLRHSSPRRQSQREAGRPSRETLLLFRRRWPAFARHGANATRRRPQHQPAVCLGTPLISAV